MTLYSLIGALPTRLQNVTTLNLDLKMFWHLFFLNQLSPPHLYCCMTLHSFPAQGNKTSLVLTVMSVKKIAPCYKLLVQSCSNMWIQKEYIIFFISYDEVMWGLL